MNEPIYIVKFKYNHYLSGHTSSISLFESFKDAFNFYIDLNRDDCCFDNSFEKHLYKVVLDESNEIKELDISKI